MTGWERLAAFEGGTVMSLATATAIDGARHVFAATPVGVFRSVDRGLSWHPLGGASRVAGVEVVAASPTYAEDGTVFAGAYDGLFRWREGGTAWQHLLSESRVTSLACAPGDPADDARGDDPIVLAGTAADGILISRDGGRSWNGANAGLLDLSIHALALSPAFAQDGVGFAATGGGVYRTRNGAESWRRLDLDTDDAGFEGVTVSSDFVEDRVLLASSYDRGVYRSDDAGRSWTHLADLDGWPAYSVACWSGGRVGLATEIGLGCSDDNGRTWRFVCDRGGAPIISVALVACGADPAEDVLLVSLNDRIMRSEDGGQTWTLSVTGLSAVLLTSLVFSPSFELDQTVFSVLPWHGISVSSDSGRSWTELSRGADLDDSDDLDSDDAGPPEIDAPSDDPLEGPGAFHQIAVTRAADAGRLIYAASSHGLHLSRDDGATWARALLRPASRASEQMTVVEEVAAISVLPGAVGDVILAALTTGRGLEWALVTSEDSGVTWHELRTPLAQAAPVALMLSPGYADDSTVYVATHGAHTRFAVGDLILWRTTDRGRRWDRWLEVPDVPGGAVNVVALPSNRWGDTVMLGLGGRVLRPRQNAWEVTGGARRPVWDAAALSVQELTTQSPVIAGLAASPAYPHDRTVFAATSAGVYVSRDGGASFSAWNDGLEPAATVAVAPSPAYARDRLVYALGLGGTIWRRRDEEHDR